MTDFERLLIMDVETTGLNPTTDSVVEVGAIVWSVQHRAIIQCWSAVVKGDRPGALEESGLPLAVVEQGIPALSAVLILEAMLEATGRVALAHNAPFDRNFLNRLAGKPLAGVTWLDSKRIEWPCPSASKSLSALATAHGVVGKVHRALGDCLLLAGLLERASAEPGWGLQAQLQRALMPSR